MTTIFNDNAEPQQIAITVLINQLRDEALRISTEHGFKDATIGEDIALMHSELSEALEDHRAGKAPTEVWYDISEKYGPMPKPCGIPSEMADVIIRIFHFCGKHKIDIGFAVLEKMRFNDTRPFMHGGKKI